MVKIRQNLMPSSLYSWKSPYSMTPTRIVVHNTANDASAENEIKFMNKSKAQGGVQSSYHYAVDDKEAVQGLPENRNGFHAGDGSGKGNRQGIAIEICYSKSGGDRFAKAEENAVELIVDILKRYGWGIDKVTKHQDYANKYCPHRTLDLGWDRFIKMIQAKLNNVNTSTGTNTPTSTNTSKKAIKYVYNCDELNVRTGAGTNYKAVNSLACRTAVTVYEVKGNWARIQEGMWVSNKYLANSTKNHVKSMEVTNCSSLNVRTGAGTKYKAITTIPKNCVVSVLQTKNGWTRIGSNKWVSSKYLK